MAGQGQFNSFADAVSTKRTISSLIHNIDPRDVPCISYFGTNNQSKFKLDNFPNHKYEWLGDTLRIRVAEVEGTISGTTAALVVVAGQGIYFKPGDIWIAANGDYFWVDSISTDTLTVIPNFGAVAGTQGTWNSAVTDGTTLTYHASARLEGDDSDQSHWTNITAQHNFSEIMHAEIRVSGSELDATSRYGISNQFQYQLEKYLGGAGAGNGKQGRAGDLMIDLENTFFSRIRKERTSTVPGVMGGFPYFVTTNVSSNGGTDRTLTQDILEGVLRDIWADGGQPDVIMVNSRQKKMINSFYAGSVRTERSERTGGVVIDAIETDFGNYDVMLSRRVPQGEVYIATRDQVGWVTHRPWFVKQLAESGDYTKKEVVGEFGFVVTTEKGNGLIKDLTES